MLTTKCKARLSDRMVDWECGKLSAHDSLDLFGELIESGIVWHLQGDVYGRQAVQLIASGWISETGRVLAYPVSRGGTP
jgi:hypothetical protein